MGSKLDWPKSIPRTPADEREHTNKFDVNFQRSERELRRQMRLMGVEHYRLEHEKGRGGDPGVALYWTLDGNDRAVGYDRFEKKRNNLRQIRLWVEERRKAADRGIQTANEQFADAALPPGDEEEVAAVAVDPYEVLPVDPDAPPSVRKAAADAYLKQSHPDHSGSAEQLQHARRVREAVEEDIGE